MSAFGGKADMTYCGAHVRYDPGHTRAQVFSAFVDLFHCTEGFRGVNDFPTDQCELRLQRMNFIFRDR